MEGRAPSPVQPGVAPGSPTEKPVPWVIPRFDLVDRELVEQVHAAGRKIMVWTVNRAEQMRDLAKWGVDAIISDETEPAVQVFSGRLT
jgi:glycerophosphoryl diester phosphodiesterase